MASAVSRLKKMFEARGVECLTASIGRREELPLWLVTLMGPKGVITMAAVLKKDQDLYSGETLREVVNRALRRVDLSK